MGEASVDGYAEAEGSDECAFCFGSYGDGYGCNAEHDVWICTRERGHEGEHVACGDLHARAKWLARRASDAGGVTDAERLDCIFKYATEMVARIPGGIRCIDNREDIDAVIAAHAAADRGRSALQRERAAKGEA